MLRYGPTAVERAMRMQEVILRVLSGELNWLQAADILRMSPRTLRRWKRRYAVHGYDGLLDRRTGRPSPRRAPVAEVARVLRLYRERCLGFNVRHFLSIARREHGVRLSYTFVKGALQGAGLVATRRPRGRHRRRREPRPCRGELLHLDGSPHEWLARCPGEQQTLIMSVDDATNEVLYAQLEPRETTAAIMRALASVLRTDGIPMGLYTDRASWAVVTKAGGAVDKAQRTQVGRALQRLGIEHIVAYSPQARGRSERMNGTWQGRLVNELRVAGIRTVAAANEYIRTHFLPVMNAEFCRMPADPASAFVGLNGHDLDQILCHEEPRTVAKDNTVSLAGVRLQLTKQPGRVSCAGLQVLVRRHLDGTHSVWRGLQRLGRYDAQGEPAAAPPRRRNPPVGLRPPSGFPRPRRERESIERSVHLSN